MVWSGEHVSQHHILTHCLTVLSAAKLVPVGYGIMKLQIACVVEDDKVGLWQCSTYSTCQSTLNRWGLISWRNQSQLMKIWSSQ